MNPDEYLKLAAVEDRMWFFRSLHAHVDRELKRRIGPECPAQVLDAGCGAGGLIARLAPGAPGWQWRGLDVSPMACELARARTGVAIAEAPIEAMPFPAATFDAVTCIDVIGHVDDPARGLREVARCLRPGGILVLSAAAYRWLTSYHDAACRTRRRYRRSELVADCAAAGLEVERSTYLFALTLPLLVAKRKLFRRAGDTSDVRIYPWWIERGCGALSAVERAAIAAGGRSPFGSSVLVVARRPGGAGQARSAAARF